MTDLLDRDDLVPTEAVDRAPRPDGPGLGLAPAVRVTLAAVSAGAGAIHLAMVPPHWGESVAEGVGFAVSGWLQLAFAAVVLVRPTRNLLRLGIVLNLAAIGAWVVSRTAGLPFG